MSKRRGAIGVTGLTLLVAGVASLVFGLLSLDATVEGAYFNRSADAAPGDAVYATSVDGKRWLIVGTALVALGGVALGSAALHRD